MKNIIGKGILVRANNKNLTFLLWQAPKLQEALEVGIGCSTSISRNFDPGTTPYYFGPIKVNLGLWGQNPIDYDTLRK